MIPGSPGVPGISAPSAGSQNKRRSYIPRVGSGIGPGGGNEKSSGTEIFVRSHTGWGESAAFDTVTGVLRPVELAMGGLAGVYGDLGGVPIVFYRRGSGLSLRVHDRTIDLDSPAVTTLWERLDPRQTRFSVAVDGVTVCDLRYPSSTEAGDLGLLIHDVLTDPARRTQIFAGVG